MLTAAALTTLRAHAVASLLDAEELVRARSDLAEITDKHIAGTWYVQAMAQRLGDQPSATGS